MLLGFKCQTLSYHFLSPCFMDIHCNQVEMAACQIFLAMSLPNLAWSLRYARAIYSCGTLGSWKEPSLGFWLTPKKIGYFAGRKHTVGEESRQLCRWYHARSGPLAPRADSSSLGQSVFSTGCSHIHLVSGQFSFSLSCLLISSSDSFYTSLSPVLSYVTFFLIFSIFLEIGFFFFLFKTVHWF